MSFDWANIAANAGLGMVHGLNQHKADVKEKEQLDYDRGRQAVADQQQSELHNQTVKQNEFTLATNAREQATANRKQLMNDRIGQYQNFKAANDIDQAAKTYVDFANQDNVGNANFNPEHALSYVKNDDGTVNINVVNKSTGALIKTARENVGIDDFISATYQQIDPTATYETEVSNRAAAAKLQSERTFEERKLGLQHGYKTLENNAKYQNDLQLEGIRQNGQNYRQQVSEEGQNNRAVLNQEGQNFRLLNDPSVTNTKQGKTVASQMTNVLDLYNSNPALFSGMSGEKLANTMAIAAIESGGNPNAFNGSSRASGTMQIVPNTQRQIMNQFGIDTSTPQGNIQGGAEYFDYLLNRYGGNQQLALMGYNWGIGHSDNYQKYGSGMKKGPNGTYIKGYHADVGIPQETRDYIQKFEIAKGMIGQQQTEQKQATAGGAINQNIKNAAASLAGMFGGDNKPDVAAILGDLQGAANTVAILAQTKDRNAQVRGINDLGTIVTRAIHNTPAYRNGQLTEAQVKGLRATVLPALLGVGSMAEVSRFMKGDGKVHKPQVSALSNKQINSAIDSIDMSEPTPKPAAKAAPKQNAFIPYASNNKAAETASSFSNGLKGKPAPKAAAKPAAKPVSDQQKRKDAERQKAAANYQAKQAAKKAESDKRQANRNAIFNPPRFDPSQMPSNAKQSDLLSRYGAIKDLKK